MKKYRHAKIALCIGLLSFQFLSSCVHTRSAFTSTGWTLEENRRENSSSSTNYLHAVGAIGGIVCLGVLALAFLYYFPDFLSESASPSDAIGSSSSSSRTHWRDISARSILDGSLGNGGGIYEEKLTHIKPNKKLTLEWIKALFSINNSNITLSP